MSTCPPIFPAELWLMILGHLQDEPSPQHLARLAQVSRWFHEVIDDELFFPILRFGTRQNADEFGSSMIDCPTENYVANKEVKKLVREIRHHGDMGFQNFTFSSSVFYEELATFPNLETLIMRPKWPTANQGPWYKEWADLVYDLCMDPDREGWTEEVDGFFARMARQLRLDGLDHPSGTYWCPGESGFPDEEDVRAKMTRFCGGLLEGGLPHSLTSCHIGTDSLQKPQDPISTFFNWSICELTQIRTLCITGANFNEFDIHAVPGRGHMVALEELKLLNCRISPGVMSTLIESAASLKKLTIRGPNCSDPDGEQDLGYIEVSGALEDCCSDSLEELDIDIYWGTRSAMCFHTIQSLKKLTVTMCTILAGRDEDTQPWLYSLVPRSLETLVVRHEAGCTLPFDQVQEAVSVGRLSNLRSLVFQIPENIRLNPNTRTLQRYAKNWVNRFRSMGVELQVSLVPYPTVIGGYDACSCECLEVYHRFNFHPWDNSGFVYDDCSDEAGMYRGKEDDDSGWESMGEDGETKSSESDSSGEENEEEDEENEEEDEDDEEQDEDDEEEDEDNEDNEEEDEAIVPFLKDLALRRHNLIGTDEEYLRWMDGSN